MRPLALALLAAACTPLPRPAVRPSPALPPLPIRWSCSAGGVRVEVDSVQPPSIECSTPCRTVCGRLPLAGEP